MKKCLPIHPILFAAYPVLFLYLINLEEARIGDVARSLLALVVIFSLLFLLLRLALRDPIKTGVATSLCAILLFIYGPAFHAADGVSVLGIQLGRNRILFPLWCLITAPTLIVLLRTKRNLHHLSGFLNITGMALIGLVLLQIGIGQIGLAREGREAGWNSQAIAASDGELRWTGDGPKPDIYYIVLDAYARQDILEKHYSYDNSGFIDYLQRKGFYVASESRSNYLYTYKSLSSTLNMDYLDTLAQTAKAQPTDVKLLGEMIRDSRLVRHLKAAGYTFVFFPSDFQATDRNPNADLVMSPARINLGEFERILIKSSVLGAFNYTASAHKKRVEFVFREMRSIPDIEAPTFTFAHIVCPHAPKVFDADGNPPKQRFLPKGKKSPAEHISLYSGQLTYVSAQATKLIDTILAKSSNPPIIILQSDHGPHFPTEATEGGLLMGESDPIWLEIRTAILNAYSVPEEVRNRLYDDISPVNTFRLLLNECFGANYDHLPDVSADTRVRGDD